MRRERFVEEQDLRIEGERSGQCDALTLAARALAHAVLVVVLGQAQQLAAVRTLGSCAATAGDAAHLQGELDVLADAAVRKQRQGLEHHAGRPPVGRRLVDARAAQQDLAVARLLQCLPAGGSRVVLPEPEGPTMVKNSPSVDGEFDRFTRFESQPEAFRELGQPQYRVSQERSLSPAKAWPEIENRRPGRPRSPLRWPRGAVHQGRSGLSLGLIIDLIHDGVVRIDLIVDGVFDSSSSRLSH